jgi:hypothetical protein
VDARAFWRRREHVPVACDGRLFSGRLGEVHGSISAAARSGSDRRLTELCLGAQGLAAA